MIWLIILLTLLFLAFYNYIVSKFVHFMNSYILVPIQRFINIIIRGVNEIIKGINKPFKGLHHLSIGASLGKIFGKNIGFEITPFKEIIPEEIVPSVPKLKVKCIGHPWGYFSVFGFNTPSECKEKKEKKKKNKSILAEGGSLKYYYLFLVICLLGLMFYVFSSNDEKFLASSMTLEALDGVENPLTSMPSPSMPSPSMPSPSMPPLSMPSPSMPSTSMPSPSMPSTSMPPLSMPPLSMPSPSILPIKNPLTTYISDMNNK